MDLGGIRLYEMKSLKQNKMFLNSIKIAEMNRIKREKIARFCLPKAHSCNSEYRKYHIELISNADKIIEQMDLNEESEKNKKIKGTKLCF